MKTKFLKHAARKALTIALSVTMIVSVTACKRDVDEKNQYLIRIQIKKLIFQPNRLAFLNMDIT